MVFYMVGSCEDDGSGYIGSVHSVKEGAERAYESHARRPRNWMHEIRTEEACPRALPCDRLRLTYE